LDAQAPVTRRFALRPEAVEAPPSGIAEVFHYGQNRQGLLALWVGEGDLPTPQFIREAAVRSLAAGETFYVTQRGHPVFREAAAAYLARVYADAPAAAWSFDPARICATIGGMHALQMAMRLVAGAGDEILVLTPAWPNFPGAVLVSGATPVEVPLTFDDSGSTPRWRLDLDRLADAISPATRALVVNTPANPTGWTATRDEIAAILDLARRRGLWIVADEIYGRYVYDGDRAPSFRDVMERDDRIIFIQTLSKNWAMTGWRVGWIETPDDLGPTIENLIQYSTSGVPLFTQRAAIAALAEGDEAFLAMRARTAQNRAALLEGLRDVARIRCAPPQGAFYLFFGVEGCDDTRTAALRLVDEAGLGLAPGKAFGQNGEGWFRLCFARSPADITEAVRRLWRWLGA
jgi:aspartate/methionine/tyrosine aminotransferase